MISSYTARTRGNNETLLFAKLPFVRGDLITNNFIRHVLVRGKLGETPRGERLRGLHKYILKICKLRPHSKDDYWSLARLSQIPR